MTLELECIIVDASRSREEVCENAITELKNRKIWPDDKPSSYKCINISIIKINDITTINVEQSSAICSHYDARLS